MRAVARRMVDVLQEDIDRQTQCRGDLDQAPDPDADRAFLVLLDLLDLNAEAASERRLRDALGETERANSSTEGRIDQPSPLDASGVHGVPQRRMREWRHDSATRSSPCSDWERIAVPL